MAADDQIEGRDAGSPEETERKTEENESFLDEELIPVLLLAGVLLFLFPEPATSALGIVLVGIGVGLWLRNVVA